VDASRSIVYLSSGYFDPAHWVIVPFLIGISFLGSYIGKLILNRTSEMAFRYIVVAVIILTALYQTLRQLA
jgi:uncharacterized membrane protein YfcA